MLPQFNPTNASVIRSRAGPSETSRGPSDVRVNMPSGPLQPLLAHSAHYLALYYLVNVYTARSSFMKRTHFQLDDYKNLCSSLKWNNVINLARRVFMWRGGQWTHLGLLRVAVDKVSLRDCLRLISRARTKARWPQQLLTAAVGASLQLRPLIARYYTHIHTYIHELCKVVELHNLFTSCT